MHIIMDFFFNIVQQYKLKHGSLGRQFKRIRELEDKRVQHVYKNVRSVVFK